MFENFFNYFKENNNFRDLTNIGRKKMDKGYSFPVLTDAQIFGINPDRYKLYVALSEDLPLLTKALELEGVSRMERDEIKKNIKDIGKSLTQLETIESLMKDRVAKKKTHQLGGNKEDNFFYAQRKKIKGATDVDALHEGLREYENHPFYAPENEAASPTDRVVFIAMTFVLRIIALTLIEWGVNNRMINKFETAFYMYILVYTLLFLCWVTVINMQNKDNDLGMLNGIFYYISLKGDPKASMRIIFHSAFQFILLLIPAIVREQKTDPNSFVSFSDRRRMINSLSKFSMFMWIVTSFVAARM